MSKRKQISDETSTKKQKIASEEDQPEIVNITSKKTRSHAQKENLAWSESDMLDLLKKIEENIPPDDFLSYTSRLEKINWENIQVKHFSTQECKETWSTLYKQVRKFRFLRELVSDMRDLLKSPSKHPLKTSDKHPSKPKPPPERHPLKPKQPLNSFMLFCEAKREQVKHKNPLSHSNEILKILGQMFKNLPLEEREKYDQDAKAARQEYVVALQNFYKEHPELIPKKKNKRDRKSESEEVCGLEKPKTPFDLFVKVESEKEDAPTSRFVILQKCRDQWNEFTDKEKFFWINWAEELYFKYLENLKEYMKTHPEYEPENIKPVLNKKEERIKNRCSGKPDKPPHGPFQLFSKMILEREEVRRINTKDVLNYVSEKWRACSDEEKNEYKVRVEQMWEDYHQKMDDYLLTLPAEDRDRVRDEDTRKKRSDGKVSETKTQEVAKVPKPTPPPATAQKFFLTVYTGDGDANQVWKSMTEDEKDVFKRKLDDKRREYIAGYEKYLKSLSREELEKLGASLTSQGDSSDYSESESSEDED